MKHSVESESDSDFLIVYCYETIIFQYAIVTDRAGVHPSGYRLGPRPRAQLCPTLICS